MASSIDYFLTGGAANADPSLSLGGPHSSVALSGTALYNLFDKVTPPEATAGDVEYRAIDIGNTGDAATAETEIFMAPETTSASTQIDLGIEASPLGSTLSIADEATAPAGVTFAHYTSASKLALPDIAAGAYCRVWVRRVVTAAAPNTLLDQGSFVVWAA